MRVRVLRVELLVAILGMGACQSRETSPGVSLAVAAPSTSGVQLVAQDDSAWPGLPVAVGDDWADANKRLLEKGAECRTVAGIASCTAKQISVRGFERGVDAIAMSWAGSSVSSILVRVPYTPTNGSQDEACIEAVRKLSDAFRSHGWTVGETVLDRKWAPGALKVTAAGVAFVDGQRDRTAELGCVSGGKGDAGMVVTINDAWTTLSVPWRYPTDAAKKSLSPAEAVREATVHAAIPITNGLDVSSAWGASQLEPVIASLRTALDAQQADALSPRSRAAFHRFSAAVTESGWFVRIAAEIAKMAGEGVAVEPARTNTSGSRSGTTGATVAVTSATAIVHGQLEGNPEPLMYLLDEQKHSLAKCFAPYGVGHHVDVEFQWGSALTRVAVAQTDVAEAEFKRCVTDVVGRWRPPVPAADVPCRVAFKYGHAGEVQRASTDDDVGSPGARDDGVTDPPRVGPTPIGLTETQFRNLAGQPQWVERTTLEGKTPAREYLGREVKALGWGTNRGTAGQHPGWKYALLLDDRVVQYTEIAPFFGDLETLPTVEQMLGWNPGPPRKLGPPGQGFVANGEQLATWNLGPVVMSAQIITSHRYFDGAAGRVVTKKFDRGRAKATKISIQDARVFPYRPEER